MKDTLDTSSALPEKIVQEIDDIPPLPSIVVKVMQLIRDPESTAKQLTDVISQDQALTGNILRLCNSSYYGLPRVVSSLSQAIMYLGFHTVRNLVLTCSISKLFSPDKKVYGYKKGGLWYHAVVCALTCQIISKKIKPDIADAAFTAGLLHDIGQLVMAIIIKDTAETIVDLMESNNISDLKAERETVGFSHDELGAALANKWNFPDELVHAIRFHHTPEASKNKSILTAIVNLADAIVLELGYGVQLDQMKHPASSYALKIAKIDEELYNSLRDAAEEQISQFASQFIAIED
ncbi:MAG: HDOD domain-containing protein [Candidatus Omnitrophota bacterium]